MSVTPLKGERTGGGRKKGGGGGGRKGGKGKGRGQGPEEDTVKPAWEPNFMTIDEVSLKGFFTGPTALLYKIHPILTWM